VTSDSYGTLYIVSTPIGNLKDITFRAVEILSSVSLIAAEDTRHSKKLFQHYNISTPSISFFEHNRTSRIPQIISNLLKGDNIALISDAGTPGISDPAYRLIREAIAKDITVESIPGATALIAGVVLSGLPTDRILFEGFLPPKKGRKKRLINLIDEDATIVFYESPYRLIKTLKEVFEVLGDRPAVIARELTKMNEEIIRGTVSDLLSYFSNNKPRGEFVIMIGKNDTNVFFK
jgi:16S rRNA (cytidine1402-2'-O)-methyltransferase|tara:strand:+ start:44 stop:745 length:702 start_codon:yes stop_codon:yes gene_type:complete